MTRHILFVALCFCVLAIGCERKEPQVVISGPNPTGGPQTPADMIALGANDSGPFLRKEPVSFNEYLDFCKAINRLAEYTESGQLPLNGLGAEISLQLATWRMMRPATPTELEQAHDKIAASGTPLYLVQDWLPGSQGESDARAAREALMKDAALNGVRREIAALRATLSQRIDSAREACGEHWMQLKPALFSLAEEQKARDELSQTTSPILLRTVEGVTAARLRLRVAIQTAETDAVKTVAIKEYEDTLATTRKLLAANLTDLAAEQTTISARIRDVTTALERAGDIASNNAAAVQADLLARTLTPPPTRERAEADRTAINGAIATLADFKPAIGKLPSLDEIAAALAAVKAEIAKLRENPLADALAIKLQKQREMLTKPDASIQRQFDQQPLLLKDIATWAEAMAKRDVLTAKLKRLQAYLVDATPPAETP
jgi:hypothetical protein